MSNDDPTKNVADEQPVPTTKPTIETVLERINLLGETLQAQVTKLQNDQEAMRAELAQRLNEIDSNIRMMNRKFDVVSKDLLNIKAEVSDAHDRIDKLEKKPS